MVRHRVLKALWGLLAIVGLATIAAVLWFAAGGIGARGAPGKIETAVARTLRSVAIPDEAKRRANPVPASDAVLQEGLAHFADHCAVCHGNNGSGDTLFGRGMYPRPPDLRLASTQELTDGTLFYIIENGVKLTGMPAFGDDSEEGAAGSWGLVHFIRRLPHLTPEEIQRMEKLNPRSPETPHADEPGKPHTHKGGGH